jgi:hypothetical protein
MAALVVILGIYPALMMDVIGPAIDPIIARLEA